jgi:hypothetical protein
VEGVQELLSERVSWVITADEGPEYHSSSRRQQRAPLPCFVLDSVLCPEHGAVVITAGGMLVRCGSWRCRILCCRGSARRPTRCPVRSPVRQH